MSTIRGNVVVGAFEHVAAAEGAIKRLRELGFTDADFGLAAPNLDAGASPADVAQGTARNANAVLGAETGALSGAGLGGLLALALGTSMVPMVGPIVAGGILAAAATGAATGGAIGALVGFGLSDGEASLFEKSLNSGRIIVALHTNTRQREVAEVLDTFGADHISAPGVAEGDSGPVAHMHFGHDAVSRMGGFTASGGLVSSAEGVNFNTHSSAREAEERSAQPPAEDTNMPPLA